MNNSFLILLLAVAMLFGSGCTMFRKIFSRKGHERRVERREERREALMIKKKKSASRSKDDRDPLRDMFKIKNKTDYAHDKDLSARERELLKEHMNSNDPDISSKAIRSNYKTEQKKRQDWVFSR